MKIFARWKERRQKKRQLRKMSQVLDKLTEAAVIAFGDGCRLQVPVDLFEEDDMVSKFINQVTKEIGSSVRANSTRSYHLLRGWRRWAFGWQGNCRRHRWLDEASPQMARRQAPYSAPAC